MGFSGLAGLRRAVVPWGVVEDQPVGIDALRRDVDGAWRARQGCHYRDLGQDLPPLVARCRAAVEQHDGEARSEALALLSRTMFLVSRVSEIVGDLETGYSAAQAGFDAAQQSGLPVATGHACYRYALPLLRTGRSAEAKEVCLSGAIRLEPHAGGQDGLAVSIYGALMLMAAVSSARQSDRAGAGEALREAEGAAGRLREPQDGWWTVFGPANVALHRVSVAVELGESGEALQRSTEVDVSLFPPEARERRARLPLELARCYAAERKDEAAIHALLQAEAAVPEEVRYQTVAHDLVRAILRRSRNGGIPGAAGLAERIGVTAG